MIYRPLKATIINMANYRDMYKMVVIADELLSKVPKEKYVKFMNGSRPFIPEESLLAAFKAQNKGVSDGQAKVTLNEATKRHYLSKQSTLIPRSELGIERGENYHDFTEKRLGGFRLGYWRDCLKENNVIVTIVVSGVMALILREVIATIF